MINQRIVDQYSQFCSEANFKPFSPSTMQRILSSCSATVRKSLQGLDYIAAEGTKAFDDLTYIAGKLVDHGVDRQTGTGLEKSFKEGKQYLKTDYKETGIQIKRVYFSDPQGGKGSCDRKAATIKGHVRRYINEGHDVLTAADLKEAILSYGGVRGVRIAIVDTTVNKTVSIQGKWEGISNLNNFSYHNNSEGVTVWKAYDIGEGKNILWSQLPVNIRILPNTSAETEVSPGEFVEASSPRLSQQTERRELPREKKKEGDDERTEEDKDEEENEDEDKEAEAEDGTKIVSKNNGLFSCPCQGCVSTFQKHSSLEYHILYGKCKLLEEKHTLLDKAKILYSQKFSEGTSAHPLLSSSTASTSCAVHTSQGWALKRTKKSARFNDNQKRYLEETFRLGQETGHKANPSQVAHDLRHAKYDNGERRFGVSEF
ncbi:hypothetical protein QZH41_001408 [Actinostola sp. cb2023]|nr:hypothetical protein QZH41_001408 [Actinostola sp. cb2023]